MPLTSLSGLSALSTLEQSESEVGSSSYTCNTSDISRKKSHDGDDECC